MYRVVLIDDESTIREGLKVVVDWQSFGFEVVGEASNGLEGRGLVRDMNPHLVVLDVRMPGQDGLSMLQAIRDEGFDGQVVLLTGYKDFSYAQKAMSLKVVSYLLKPIEPEELKEILINAKKNLDRQSETIEVIQQHSEMSSERKLRNLLHSDNYALSTEDEVFAADNRYFVSVISGEGTGVIREQMEGIKNCLMVTQDEYTVVLLKNMVLETVRSTMEVLSNRLANGKVPFIACSSRVMGWSNIRLAYDEAKFLHDNRFVYGEKQIVFYDDYTFIYEELKESDFMLNELYQSIELGNLEEVDQSITSIQLLCQQSSLSTAQIKGLCVNSFVALKEQIHDSYQHALEELPSISEVIDFVYDSENLEVVLKYLKKICYKLSYDINNGPVESNMDNILGYIKENFHRNIRLEQVARLFNYNSAYLGVVFKEKTGTYFNHYLDELRIEKAKELLLTNQYKVYQVAVMVGFSNSDYFYYKFKRYEGMTPKNYIRQMHEAGKLDC